MDSTDAALIARALLREDHRAFGELVRRHQSPVRGFLTRLTRGDSHRADDLAQETFLKAWKNLPAYRGDAKFSTWLFGIAFNEFRAAARKRTEWLAGDLTGDLADHGLENTAAKNTTGAGENAAGASATAPEAEMPASLAAPDAGLRVDLEAALQGLPARERAAVLLCCQNGLSHDEAARVLQCPVGTVKTHVLRGREKLRRALSL